MIRKHLGMDPDSLEDDDWVKHAAEAIWLDKHQGDLFFHALVRFWNAINGR